MFVGGSFVGVQLMLRIFLRITPLPLPEWLNSFLATPVRQLYRDPARVIDLLGLHKNDRVADVGCGKGVFSIEAAKRVGERGVIYAVDSKTSMIDAVSRKLDALQLGKNVQLIVSPLDKILIDTASVDAAMLISALPRIPDRLATLKEIKRILKPGGVLVIGEELLEPEYVRPVVIQEWAHDAGFKLVGRSGSPFSYILKFIKPVSISEVAVSN
jgi:ubiquinone/menaquinone biosynthesis C-methylase UbiE